MCSPSPPPAPDYKGAAEATAAGNRTSQYTPYGNLVYSQDGQDTQGNPMYRQTVNLSDTGQKLLDAQNETSLGLSGLQGQGLDAVKGLFGNLPSAGQLSPNPINPGQTAQDAIMARVNPMLDRQYDRMTNQLANQGIGVGSEAYSNAARDFGQQANDAYSQAALQGIGVGQDARQRGMNEQGFYSQMPINLLNAVRTGSQVQNPVFGTTAPGADYLGAAKAQGQSDMNAYNASVGSSNSLMGGLFGLGASALMGPIGGVLAKGMMPSDRRLKSNIVRIGTHPLGIGIYEYDIGDRHEVGVMAQEVLQVKPKAVHKHPAGFLMVDYGAL